MGWLLSVVGGEAVACALAPGAPTAPPCPPGTHGWAERDGGGAAAAARGGCKLGPHWPHALMRLTSKLGATPVCPPPILLGAEASRGGWGGGGNPTARGPKSPPSPPWGAPGAPAPALQILALPRSPPALRGWKPSSVQSGGGGTTQGHPPPKKKVCHPALSPQDPPWGAGSSPVRCWGGVAYCLPWHPRGCCPRGGALHIQTLLHIEYK